MRRLRFRASASEFVSCTPALAWLWVDRLPQALCEFAFVREVKPAQVPGAYTLVLRPVGFGKVSLSLEMDMLVIKEPERRLCLQSLPEGSNADAVVTVEVLSDAHFDRCTLQISLDVSPHKPASAWWPRELIEAASAASLQVAARKMLKDMKAALENGAAAKLEGALTATSKPAEAARSAAQLGLPH